MSKLKIFIIFSLFSYSYVSHSTESNYDREYIVNFAQTFVKQNTTIPAKGRIQITPAPIDPRITVKPCDVPLSANIPENYSRRNVNVKVSCESSTPWHLFVPVKISTTVPVLVTQHKVDKGSVLDEGNLTIEWREQYKLRGETIDNKDWIIGAKSKRTLSKGSIVTKKSICVVCKGENVTITAQSNDFMIKTAGVALKNATLGEQVKVKNLSSGRTIFAQVKAVNQVVINL